MILCPPADAVPFLSDQVAWYINSLRGQDQKILCPPAEEVTPLRPSGNGTTDALRGAEEVPLIRSSGMVHQFSSRS